MVYYFLPLFLQKQYAQRNIKQHRGWAKFPEFSIKKTYVKRINMTAHYTIKQSFFLQLSHQTLILIFIAI